MEFYYCLCLNCLSDIKGLRGKKNKGLREKKSYVKLTLYSF